MRFVSTLAVLAVVVAAAPVAAEERGTIRGQIVNETTGRPQQGVIVKLEGFDRDGADPVRRTVTTGRDGRYSFEDLSTGREWLYVIDARHDGGLFPGRPLTIPSNTTEPPVIDTTLRVWDTTNDPASVLIRRDNLFAVLDDNSDVGIIESVSIANTTDLAYVGRGARGTGSDATFGFPLPDAADVSSVRIVDSPFDVPTLVRTDFGFALTVAIPPGQNQITYSYRVTGGTGTFDLSRTLLYPTLEMSSHAEPPLEIESSRLEPNGEVEIDGDAYTRWTSTDTLDAGDPVQILATATAAPSWWVFAGAGTGLVGLIAILYLFTRRRPSRDAVEPAPPVRDDLVAAIAALDLEFESGSLPRDEWQEKRHELKSRLQEMSSV
ncbi:MAG: carboxypeptidase-like regulatory domain-containing protein [Actinomycetota bacterium]